MNRHSQIGLHLHSLHKPVRPCGQAVFKTIAVPVRTWQIRTTRRQAKLRHKTWLSNGNRRRTGTILRVRALDAVTKSVADDSNVAHSFHLSHFLPQWCRRSSKARIGSKAPPINCPPPPAQSPTPPAWLPDGEAPPAGIEWGRNAAFLDFITFGGLPRPLQSTAETAPADSFWRVGRHAGIVTRGGVSGAIPPELRLRCRERCTGGEVAYRQLSKKRDPSCCRVPSGAFPCWRGFPR